MTIDARGTLLALPPLDEARSATLTDGWPVWVIRHANGGVTVVSAVAPPRTRSAATLFGGRAGLLRWLPGSRRLLAGDVVYDDHGHVVGYGTNNGCADDCPRIEEPAPDERDLDTFAVTTGGDRVGLGELRHAGPRPAESRWVDWDHDEHADHELDVAGDERWPVVAVAIAAALRQPVGTYSVVAGKIVQSTVEPPRVCGCGACDAGSPIALGIAAVSIDKHAVHEEPGQILVRRDAGGLAVIATSRVGGCAAR